MELGCFPQSFVCEGSLLMSCCVQPCITTPAPKSHCLCFPDCSAHFSIWIKLGYRAVWALWTQNLLLEELLPHPRTQGAPSDASVVFSA